jgi:hypothetical protein
VAAALGAGVGIIAPWWSTLLSSWFVKGRNAIEQARSGLERRGWTVRYL